ncbi:hypothetical protein C731_0948 [Mycolicibacterium hassiacum DSM 44199]|uniref:Uncharacterized protein n=1 Tax=Mycolicibacterium hassiacum (strain DSM 44199 / CIP 105218 / JCM 12690 / 3849) TaxID=1122247 RepID=K5BHQ7_MYCHD|nr:hypothetical protein C731_0948 [Mycolicibacterium hassiacum DSM 44199]
MPEWRCLHPELPGSNPPRRCAFESYTTFAGNGDSYHTRIGATPQPIGRQVCCSIPVLHCELVLYVSEPFALSSPVWRQLR